MDEATPMTTEAMNKSFRSKVVVVATPTNTVDFDYTGTEQVFTAPADGKYKIELWEHKVAHITMNIMAAMVDIQVALLNLHKMWY